MSETNPIFAVALLGVLVFVILYTVNSKPLSDEFRRMYGEWQADRIYTDTHGNKRRDVDPLIDAWLELNAMGLGVTKEEMEEDSLAQTTRR